MSRKTILAMIFTTIIGIAVYAQNAPVAAPGAALYVYTHTDSSAPLPDADPIVAVVDNSDQFSKLNVKKNDETKKFHNQPVFLVWNGYVEIPAKGKYTFALSFDHSGTSGWCHDNVIVKIGTKNILNISKTSKKLKENDSRTLSLEKGDYEFTIIFKLAEDYQRSPFSLKMWNRNRPLKKTNITPATMYHAE